MSKFRMIRSVLKEYGFGWAINRALYSAKLKMLRVVPATEKWFEKKTAYPDRLELFRIDVSALKQFLLEMPADVRDGLIAAADKVCDGTITGFSSVELHYGSPVDWQLNPLTQKRCDERQKWYRIPDFDSERGDIKAIWEASRFSHFVTLSRAFLLTGEKRYYQAFSGQLADWLQNNPYGRGANFKCSQECSLRMVNALLAYTVFRACGIATDADTSNVRDLIDRCYRKVLGNFFYAYRCIKNNHTISELMGMIVGAWCCGDRKRLGRAFSRLDRVIDEQFTSDGGYRQFSFNYQRLALQDLECVLSIEQTTGMRLSPQSKEKIRNAAMLMYQCQDETGDMPNYGSNDGALVFPVTSCGYRDFRPVINTVWTLCTGKQLYADGLHQEELLWFAGEKPIREYEREDAVRGSAQFPHAGLFTLRGDRSWAMIVSNDYRSRPAHMDQLHLDLWMDGVNVLCDAGTYSYADTLGKQLIKNDNHNTAAVPGTTQMNASGPFLLYDWTRRELSSCDDHTFDGRIRSKNGYCHARQIKQAGDSYEIKDVVDRDYKIAFHTPCDVVFEDGKAVLSHHGRRICEIIGSVGMEQEPAVRSLYYLRGDHVRRIVLRGRAGTEITTVIKSAEGEET